MHFKAFTLSFQFTTSQGGRRRQGLPDRTVCKLSIHDLTRRSTCFLTNPKWIGAFQFTTSQGGRLRWVKVFQVVIDLSIHDLTRRSTSGDKDRQKDGSLSIHDLTRRSTKVQGQQAYKESDLSIHDLTRRSTFPIHNTPTLHYCFQFTTSQGGRHYATLLSNP